MNNRIRHALLLMVVVILPFVCIGSFYFAIPGFIEVYRDLIGLSPLPNLMKSIIEVPLWVWLAISTLLATLNVLNLNRFKRATVSALSAGITMIIPIIVIFSLFLPLQITIESLDTDGRSVSEQDGAGQPDNHPEKPKNRPD